jgi:hypothetical protein
VGEVSRRLESGGAASVEAVCALRGGLVAYLRPFPCARSACATSYGIVPVRGIDTHIDDSVSRQTQLSSPASEIKLARYRNPFLHAWG